MKLKWHHLMLTSTCSHCSCIYVKVYLCFAFVWQYLFFGVWYFDYKWMNESGFEFLVVGQGEAVHCPGTIRKYNSSKNRGKTKNSWSLWLPKDPNPGSSKLINIWNFQKVVRATEMRVPYKSIRPLNDASITWFFTVHNVRQVFALSHSFRHLLNQIEAQRT